MKTISCCKRSMQAFATVFGLLVLAGPASALALVLCPITAQDLQDDLVAASDGGIYAGQDIDIWLAPGTYSTGALAGGGPFTYHSTSATGQVAIIGGFNGTGCPPGNFVGDASLAVLDGNFTTQVLNIQNKNAATEVEFLTVQNGESATAGGGVAINTSGAGGTVYLNDNIIQNNHTASIGGGFAIDSAGTVISAAGNLVAENAADGGWGAGFEYSRSGGSRASVSFNTIYKNTTTAVGGTGGLYCCGTPASSPFVYANIFWQNKNYGIDLEGTLPKYQYNDYGTVTGNTTPDSTNVSLDPKFVDAANGNVHLASNSPLFGLNPLSVYASLTEDLDGVIYPSHGFVDLGAYEDTIFTDHGFESN